MEGIEQVIERYKKHLVAINGEQNAKAFSESPYFVKARYNDDVWYWDEDKLRRDTARLAEQFIRYLSGNLTEQEFDNLCHNVHEKGTPYDWSTHEKNCYEFRCKLFNKQPVQALAPEAIQH